MKRRRAGFTLLELMVVLALFAITAMAAVPIVLGNSLASPEQKTATAMYLTMSKQESGGGESYRRL